MRAIRHALAYRDFKAAPELCPGTPPDPAVVMRWRARLGEVDLLDEREALRLLADFGVPVVNARIAESEPQTLAAALGIGYPVALKTAAPGITHKTDRAGVSLGLEDEDALRRAYRDLSSRLGSRVSVSAMAPAGVEVALGVVRDPDFGPLVMIGTGGVLVELLEDTRFALPPIDEERAGALIAGLRLDRLLGGPRRRPAADRRSLCRAVSRLSRLAAALGEAVAEIDVNPLIVSSHGCLAVDAVVKGRASAAAAGDIPPDPP